MICRFTLVISTSSLSIRINLPTPERARASAENVPTPPIPNMATVLFFNISKPSFPIAIHFAKIDVTLNQLSKYPTYIFFPVNNISYHNTWDYNNKLKKAILKKPWVKIFKRLLKESQSCRSSIPRLNPL